MKPRSLGTHDGTFHADEVTACALLLQYDLINQDLIIRTRDMTVLNNCEYVCDVGGLYDPASKRFDHHQVDYSGQLSSAGMILNYLKDQKIVSQEEFNVYYGSLVQGVDAIDNGISPKMEGLCTFSSVIANMVPVEHGATSAELDSAFMDAVTFVRGHLRRLMQRLHYSHSCKHLVEEAMKASPTCLLFSESLPWVGAFFELGGQHHPAQFVIMPAGPHWKLRAIPPSPKELMRVRTALPAAWAGLLNEDLANVSGIPGAIFCHKGRFISIWKTREAAQMALEKTLALCEGS